MNFKCPACGEHSIPLLTKFLTFETKRANRFICTACSTELKCDYSPMLWFMIGVLLGFAFLTSGNGLNATGFLIFGALVMVSMLFVIPIRSVGRHTPVAPRIGSPKQFAAPYDQGLYAIESKILSIAVWLAATIASVKIIRSRVHGDLGFGGLIYLIEAALIGGVVSALYIWFIYRVGRENLTLRICLDVAALASLWLALQN